MRRRTGQGQTGTGSQHVRVRTGREITMKNVFISASDYDDILAVHEALAANLDFPSYYGKNLDALHDVLSESDEPIRIEISFAGAENPSLIHALLDMINVILETEKENESLELILRE